MCIWRDNDIVHDIMGYSRNYQKYWEEKKRKRDEEVSLSSAPLPQATLGDNESGGQIPDDPNRNHSAAEENINEDVFIDCNEFLSDDESGRGRNSECEDMSRSLVDSDIESQISDTSNEYTDDNDCGDNPTMHFTSKTYKKTAVPVQESCSFELMRLLDKAGSPRYLYDEVKALLNKQSKNGFHISEAMSREVLMKSLYHRFACPQVERRKVSSYDVYKFPFVGMLQDLLDNCGSDIHIIENIPGKSDQNISLATKSELWNSSWMADTFRNCQTYKNFNKEKDIMLPLILYMDKTGTDALQRYSLEPVLFTTAAIYREAREKDRSWRHLGFIPPLAKSDHGTDTYDQNQLQLYHDLLAVLLEDLILAQKNPPVVTIERNGEKKQLIARLPVMIVMGDQKSQDTLCGRKHANSGGAGRVHRSCMCSYITVDDAAHQCVDVCSKTIKNLIASSLTSTDEFIKIADRHVKVCNTKEKKVIENYLKRQQQMNSQILQYPFTQHALRNAFDEVDFGSWNSGIFTATFDDFMHSTESGLFEYIGDLVFDGLTKTEKVDLEVVIRKFLLSARSSVRSNYPRWRLTEGFSNQTRITCGEKVGSIFILALSLQYTDAATIVRKGHARQRQKYLTFWSPKNDVEKNNKETKGGRPRIDSVDLEETDRRNNETESQTPFYWEKHMQANLSVQEIKKRLIAMSRHGFDWNILQSLDILQIHSLISHCDLGDCEYPESFPKKDIPSYYSNLGSHVKIPNDILHKAVQAFTPTTPSDVLNRTRFLPVEGTVPKHYRRKPKRKGVGSTAAILTTDIRCFLHFMEYLLSFHAFCRYSFTLPAVLQDDIDLIDFGSRTIVQYYEKLVYRGDDSVDSRTTKVHANKRVGQNHKYLGSCMHADCQTGERLLKTKAKSVAATAQQRGNSIFECQAMHRIQDETVMSKYEAYLAQQDAFTAKRQKRQNHDPSLTDTITRCIPNFRYCSGTGKWLHLDRKGKVIGKAHIERAIEEAFFRLEPSLDAYEIHCEIQLRDGSRVRATPNYGKTGPWYDFVNVKWDNDPSGLYPARCLAFYQKRSCDEDGSPQVMALIHGADKPKARGSSSFVDTLLTSHYAFEYTSSKKPKIYAVPVATIESAVLCFHHDPPTEESLFHPSNHGFMLIRPRNEWAYVWLAWSKTLRESNSQARLSNRKSYVDLGSDHIMRQVRKKLQEYIP